MAVLAGDARTVASVRGRQQCGPGWVSHVLQALVLGLWRDADVERLVGRAAALYGERRRALLEALTARGIGAHGASGLNVWVPVGEEAAVVASMLQRGWVLAPGGPHRLAGSTPAVRITIATLAPPEAPVLAEDLASVLAPSGVVRDG